MLPPLHAGWHKTRGAVSSFCEQVTAVLLTFNIAASDNDFASGLGLVAELLQQLLALQLGATSPTEDEDQSLAGRTSYSPRDNGPNNGATSPVPLQAVATITTTIMTESNSSFQGHSTSQTVRVPVGSNGCSVSEGLPATPVKLEPRTTPLSPNSRTRMSSPPPMRLQAVPFTPTRDRWYAVIRGGAVGVMQGWWCAINSLSNNHGLTHPAILVYRENVHPLVVGIPRGAWRVHRYATQMEAQQAFDSAEANGEVAVLDQF